MKEKKIIVRVLVIVTLICFGFNLYGQKVGPLQRSNTGISEQEYYFAFTEATKFYLFGNYVQAVNLYRECLKIKPNSGAVHYQLAKIFTNTGNTAMAKSHAKKACEYSVDNKWYLKELADIYQLEQKYDSAVIFYEKLYKMDPENLSVIFDIAALYERLGSFSEAFVYLDLIDKKIGLSKEVAVSRYRLYSAMNLPEKALEQLKIAYDLSGNEYAITGMTAEFYRNQHLPDSAKKYYDRIYPEYKDDPAVIFSYGDFLLEQGSIENAREVLLYAMLSNNIDNRAKTAYFYRILQDEVSIKTIVPLLDTLVSVYYSKYGDDLRSASIYSDIQFRLGNYEKSANALKRIINIDNSNYAAYEQLIFCENVLGNPDSVLFYSDIAIIRFSDKPVLYLFNGSAKLQKKEYEKAAIILEGGLKLADSNSLKLEFHSILAECYENLKQYEKSVLAFKTALEIDTENIPIRNNYAYYLSLRGVDLSNALDMSGYTIKKEPNNSTYLDTYAWILYKMKKFKKAKKYIAKALLNGGDKNSDILIHYGEIVLSLQEYESALVYFNRAIEVSDADSKIEILNRINEVTQISKQ